MKVRDLIKKLKEDGWYYVNTEGDHHQYKHPTKPGKVTVKGQPGDDISTPNIKSIERQAQIKLK